MEPLNFPCRHIQYICFKTDKCKKYFVLLPTMNHGFKKQMGVISTEFNILKHRQQILMTFSTAHGHKGREF